jgi:hypothetical protein
MNALRNASLLDKAYVYAFDERSGKITTSLAAPSTLYIIHSNILPYTAAPSTLYIIHPHSHTILPSHSGPQYEDALKLLFGAVKSRWPEVRTLAVLPWAPSPSLPVDIWVVLYPKLDDIGNVDGGGAAFREVREG